MTVSATVAPASASGGVEVESVLMTPPRKGHGITTPGMKASPSAAGRSTPPSRVIRDVRASTVSAWGRVCVNYCFTILDCADCHVSHGASSVGSDYRISSVSPSVSLAII